MSEHNHPIEKLRTEFTILRENHRFITGEVRDVSARIFRQMPKETTIIFSLCEELLELRVWEMTIVAFDWAYRMRNYYDESTFDLFDHWLKHYISDWWDCDDFCTHAVGELMIRYPQLMPKIFDWCKHDNFAVRRCAPVTLILPIKKRAVLTVDPFEVAERLKNDPHYLVLKGYGWMLKVLSSSHPDQVISYLENNHDTIPRVAYRYALEKLDKNSKLRLMKLTDEN
jgi:3-methyladenine DNA glycosylase AlkD